jgi:hypothetical protein
MTKGAEGAGLVVSHITVAELLHVGAHEGFVSVGDDADTAAFTVGTVRRWWDEVGRRVYSVDDPAALPAEWQCLRQPRTPSLQRGLHRRLTPPSQLMITQSLPRMALVVCQEPQNVCA